MALVVEDGTGRSDAESYLSEADADTYNTAHTASADWDGASSAEKEVALRRATQYLDIRYGGRWKGTRSSDTQALAWPRAGVTDFDDYLIASDALPQKLKDACAEAAERMTTEEMLEDQADGGTVQSNSVTVGPISESITYVGGNPPQKAYPKVDSLLRSLLEPTGRVRRG